MGEPGSGSDEPCGASSGGGTDNDTLDPTKVASMTADELKKFIDTGRTGRRNAVPDVSQHDAATSSTAGMAEAMETLSVQSGSSCPSEEKKEGDS